MMKEIDGFIDAMTKASRLVDLKAKRSHAIQRAKPRCGNCNNWMKSSKCPKEVNVNGRSKGPSCEGFACPSFVEDSLHTDIFKKQIAEYDAEIQLINI